MKLDFRPSKEEQRNFRAVAVVLIGIAFIIAAIAYNPLAIAVLLTGGYCWLCFGPTKD